MDRPGRRSGLHVETPDSLLLGRHEMEYSILAHPGNEVDGAIGIKASEFTTPFMTVPVSVKREAGSLGVGYETVYDYGMDAVFSILPGVTSLEQALKNAYQNIVSTARNIAKLI